MTKDDMPSEKPKHKPRIAGRTNLTGPTSIPVNAPRDAVREEFARRLQAAMVKKGWNQSELSRQATLHMGSGSLIRDTVSKYINADALPGPERLHAIAQALGVEVSDLLPTRGITQGNSGGSSFEMRDVGDGMAWVRINQMVRWEDAVRITEILKGYRAETKD